MWCLLQRNSAAIVQKQPCTIQKCLSETCLWSNKALFTILGSRPDLAHKLQFPNPCSRIFTLLHQEVETNSFPPKSGRIDHNYLILTIVSFSGTGFQAGQYFLSRRKRRYPSLAIFEITITFPFDKQERSKQEHFLQIKYENHLLFQPDKYTNSKAYIQ